MFCSTPAGIKDDGSTKLRVVYDLTCSGINDATEPAEKLKCDTLDMFVQLILLTQTFVGVCPAALLRVICTYAFRIFAGFTCHVESRH